MFVMGRVKYLKKVRLKPVIALFIIMPMLFLSYYGCNRDKNHPGNETKKLTGFENDAYVNFRSFQNPDTSWGFTIFVNSMPYRHYSKIPFKNASCGFVSRNEADKVAGLFVKLIMEGDSSPRLSGKSIDTLGITIKN
jgi:hypothetical protein